MVTLVSAILLVKWLACLNLSGVYLGHAPRHNQSRAWRSLKDYRLRKPIFRTGSSPGRWAVHVIAFQLSQNLKGIFVLLQPQFQTVMASGPASNSVWWAVIAQAIQANLLAKAQATTVECRRLSNVRTHSANALC
jgi:hypothetical protein